jgi:glycogen synthase
VNQRLQQLLQELHTELGKAGSIDAKSRQDLQTLAQDIEAAVAASGEAAPAGEGDNQLQQAVLEFETEHPRIAGILGQIADALAKIGI